MDDELDRLKPVGLPADKQHWNIEDLNAKDIGLYKKAHSEELKKRKSINTAVGCGIAGVAVAIAVTYFVIDAALGDLRI